MRNCGGSMMFYDMLNNCYCTYGTSDMNMAICPLSIIDGLYVIVTGRLQQVPHPRHGCLSGHPAQQIYYTLIDFK